MLGSAKWCWAPGLLLAACGGHSTSSADSVGGADGGAASLGGAAGAVSAAGSMAAAGVGGDEPGPRGEGGAGASGGEGGGGGLSSGGSEDCPSLPLSCSGSRDSVNVNGVELSFPGAGSCGVCTATCVECERFCTLPIMVTPSCGGARIRLFVCSTVDGRGTCLNTTSSEPYYVDDAGKRWSVVTLSADRAMDFTRVGLVQSSLSLTITDGSATRVLSVLVHACNPERLYFLPC